MGSRVSYVLKNFIDYDRTDIKRINHALKVYGFAKAIAFGEDVDESDMEILEAAAVVHDIGIHESERIYGSCDGKKQEELGPAVAEPLLKKAGFNENEISKICYLISHHHTYNIKDNVLLNILIEADFIVNIDEGDFPKGTDYKLIKERNFVTKTGKLYMDRLILSGE